MSREILLFLDHIEYRPLPSELHDISSDVRLVVGRGVVGSCEEKMRSSKLRVCLSEGQNFLDAVVTVGYNGSQSNPDARLLRLKKRASDSSVPAEFLEMNRRIPTMLTE